MTGTYGQAVAVVDLVDDAHMLWVVGVKHLGGYPLVRGKQAARLQHAGDLPIHLLQLQHRRRKLTTAGGRSITGMNRVQQRGTKARQQAMLPQFPAWIARWNLADTRHN